eukprot:c20821_g1_i4.p1 GENE.c20821_g1_i4~~c20821_g1_i4.p1  ORF type:complete len:831 (+),score=229.34 c20821_g1_i4:2-2494(+)
MWAGWAMSVFLRNDHEVIQFLVQSILIDVVGVKTEDLQQKVNVDTLTTFVELGLENAMTKTRALARIAERLGEVVFEQAQSMKQMMAREESPNDGKFGTLNLGEAKDFFAGLKSLVGEPNFLDLHRGVEDEHKSEVEFTTNNYNVTTTPRREWLLAFQEAVENGGTKRVGDTVEKMPERTHIPSKQLLDEMLDRLKKTSPDFGSVTQQQVDELKLTALEVACLRMYTGPMFQEYNNTLRKLGQQRLVQNNGDDNDGRNHYATTIHLIASGLVKLGRIQPALRLYRGIKGLRMPDKLIHTNEQSRVRGGTEFGFMSCSTERGVALQYGKSGYLFELTTGLVTRGANLSWLSYYPEEKEVCLPPCTALELRRRDRMDNNAVVMEMTVTSNPGAATIEEFVERRSFVAKELITTLKTSFEPMLYGGERMDDQVAIKVLDHVCDYVARIDPRVLNTDPTLMGLVVQAGTDIVAALRESRGRWGNGMFSTWSDVTKTIKALIEQKAYQALDMMLGLSDELVVQGQISQAFRDMMGGDEDWPDALFKEALTKGVFYLPRLAELATKSAVLDMSNWSKRSKSRMSFESLAATVSKSNITCLLFGENTFGVRELGLVLDARIHAISGLSLANNRVGTEEVQLLCTWLQRMPQLTSLNLSGSRFHNLEVLTSTFTSSPREECALETLALAGCQLQSTNSEELMRLVMACPRLKSLDVSDNALGTAFVQEMANQRSHTFEALVRLDLNGTGIDNNAALQLAGVLGEHAPNLMHLGLKDNGLWDSGLEGILNQLGKRLNTLWLQGNASLRYWKALSSVPFRAEACGPGENSSNDFTIADQG